MFRIFCKWMLSCPRIICWKDYLFSIVFPLLFCQRSVSYTYWGLFYIYLGLYLYYISILYKYINLCIYKFIYIIFMQLYLSGVLYSVSLIHLSILLPTPCCFDCCNFPALNPGSVYSLTFFFFFKIMLALLDHLPGSQTNSSNANHWGSQMS